MRPVAFFLGYVAMGSLCAGLFFLKFWRRTKDRLFLAFSLFFMVEFVHRMVVGVGGNPGESVPLFYLARLITAAVLVYAIFRKNM